jgi:hypothetical protein
LRFFLAIILLFAASTPAFAVEPSELERGLTISIGGSEKTLTRWLRSTFPR